VNRRLVVAAVAVVMGLGLIIYGGSGVLRVRAMQQEIRQLEAELATLRAQTDKLSATIHKLRHDPAYIEKLAREDFGYVREGETVLKFPTTKPK
jgi:cell division protein FtsB